MNRRRRCQASGRFRAGAGEELEIDDPGVNRVESPGAEEVLGPIRSRGRRGMTASQLVAHLLSLEPWAGLGRSEMRQLLRPTLRGLQRQGALVLGRGKRYFVPEHSDQVTGTLRLTRERWALVRPERVGGPPVQVPVSALHGAMDGDRVVVRLERSRRAARAEGHREGVVVEVLERGARTVVGRWRIGAGRPRVQPLDRRLGLVVEVQRSRVEGEPEDGELVVVSLESASHRTGLASGTLLERIGHFGEPGVEERAAIRMFELVEEFSAEALDEAAALPEGVLPADLEGRWDLRDRPAITIDPESARDFDDAVNASPGEGDVIVVEVHIADVSHYVRPDSALDNAARARGTSVYLPGRCLPMLPPAVSNRLCCLRQGEDRLCWTARLAVARDGATTLLEAGLSVIRSRRRCTYTEVFGWLQTPPDQWPRETEGFAGSLRRLAEAAARLQAARARRGSLDFDFPEPEVVLDGEGRVESIRSEPRNQAHRLIEELMVAANRAIAELLEAHEQPALHRVHDRPDPQRIEDLARVLAEYGQRLDGDPWQLEPVALQQVLEAIRGRPQERLLSTLVLRALARAVYSPEPRGHYALAVDSYLHFTSPIRRYPDLVVHRALRRLRLGKPARGLERDLLEQELHALAEACTSAEQRAEAAERQVVEWKCVLYLADKVGELFEGHISGVTAFGVFVQLDEVPIDGLVHVADLDDDHYDFDPDRHRLLGHWTGRVLRLGDRLRTRLVRVDVEAMQVGLVAVGAS